MPGVESALIAELKQLVVTALRMEDFDPEEIGDDEPLFGDDGLGLDSVDALELVVHIEQQYGIQIEDEEVGRKAFASIAALAEFIAEKKA
ncbi:MAG: acyl carrier protein [Proteobacteria bacterium]|nr:acyl carrier protein [Pseudomonadota bacterium]MBU1639519.1 acyl carrier protein [Pseudomonadota bacterium]